MQSTAKTAVGYLRTSSQINAGDKGSQARQRAAIKAYAEANGLEIVKWYFDAGISGAMPISDRPQFSAMLDRLLSNGTKIIVTEAPSRLARDIVIQELAFLKLKEKGIQLIAADSPEFFLDDDTPTRKLVRGLLGVISAFERDGVVAKLRAGRDRASKKLGRRVEGRKGHPQEVVRLAKRLRRKSPKTGRRRTLAKISRLLADQGYMNEKGEQFHTQSIHNMVAR